MFWCIENLAWAKDILRYPPIMQGHRSCPNYKACQGKEATSYQISRKLGIRTDGRKTRERSCHWAVRTAESQQEESFVWDCDSAIAAIDSNGHLWSSKSSSQSMSIYNRVLFWWLGQVARCPLQASFVLSTNQPINQTTKQTKNWTANVWATIQDTYTEGVHRHKTVNPSVHPSIRSSVHPALKDWKTQSQGQSANISDQSCCCSHCM